VKHEDVKPGTWVRNKFAPYLGPAFVTFITADGFKYHLAEPWKNRATDEGWHLGGEVYAYGLDQWEPCASPFAAQSGAK
jgi:hypothetical protein